MYLRYLWTLTMFFFCECKIEKMLETHHFSQLSNANRKFMTSTFTLPLHCLTCPQTLQIQWPEPVLLPLAWSGHFQVQVPLLLHHSQPLPKVLLLFPANERHFFLHSTTQWLSLTWKRIITYLLPAISCGVLHTWTCTQRWRTESALARTTTGLCTHSLKQISPVFWSDTGKTEKASPLCDIISDTLKDTFKDIQCMCLLYVSEISVNINHVLFLRM